MIGVGKYKTHVEHMFFNGDAVFEIEYENGKYEFEIELDNADFELDVTIIEAEELDNTLLAKATVGVLPGKTIDISLTFEDNKCNGFLKIPFVGKIKIKDAVKI